MTSTGSMTNRLESLSPELITNVVAFVPASRDLQSLCLTSKTLRAIATPALYREICITPSTPGWPFQPGSGLLSPKNRGPSTIKDLCIMMDDEEQQGAKGALMIMRLLALLPGNELTAFAIEQVPVDENLFSLLFTQQQKLERLALGPIGFDTVPLLSSGYFGNAFSSLCDLALPQVIAGKNDLHAYQYILRHCTWLSHFIIRTSEAEDEDTNEQLQDSSTREGLLLSTLLARIPHDEPKQMLRSAILQLEDVSLDALVKRLTASIDFSWVPILKLNGCEGYENLLRSLAKTFKTGPHALAFLQIQTKELKGQVLLDFLTSFKGLKSLQLGATETIHDFDASCLYGHRETLEDFAFVGQERFSATNTSGIRGLVVPTARFASRCLRVEALALTLPSITMNSSDLKKIQRFDETLVQLMNPPNLELLRIYNWPIYDGNFVFADFERDQARYLSALDGFMTNLFHRMKARGVSSMPVVCFGAETWSRVWDGHLSCTFPVVGYTHTDRRSVHGELLSQAVRWTEDQLEEAQPNCGPLDFMA